MLDLEARGKGEHTAKKEDRISCEAGQEDETNETMGSFVLDWFSMNDEYENV